MQCQGIEENGMKKSKSRIMPELMAQIFCILYVLAMEV